MAQASKEITTAPSFAGVWIGDCPEAEQFKRFNRLKDQFREIGKRAENGLTGEWRILSEEYVNGRFRLIVYLYPAKALGEADDMTVYERDMAVSKSVAALVFDIDIEKARDIQGGNEEFMLVDIVKLADFPDLKLSSRVRLYLIENEGGKIGIHVPDKPKGGRGFHVAPSLARWKADPVGFGIGKLYDDVIKRGSQIVDGVSNDGRNLRWVRGRQIDLDRICSGITIFLGADYGEVRFQEDHDCLHEFAEMAFCPIHL